MLNIVGHWGTRIETTMRHHFVPTRMAIIKRQTITKVSKDVGKLDPSYIANGNVKCIQLLWKTAWQFL